MLTFDKIKHEAGGETYVHDVPTFLKFRDFKDWYINKRIAISNARSQDWGTWWLTHPQRRQYRGIVFEPGGAPVTNDRLNLWRGFGVEPVQGDWSLMQRHIREVLAAGDKRVAEYIMRWLAWAVQHPDRQAEVALVFLGERGVGKSTLGKVMCRLFGPHSLHISSANHLTGRFNAHQRRCCFLFADEAYAPGDKTAEGALKHLITEPTLNIEAKGRDPINEPNRLHVMLASNNDWVIPAGVHERRFVVQEVSNAHRQETKWFAPLYAQMGSGGYAAMLYDLLRYELDDWHPRQIVTTAALGAQQTESLNPLDAWWFELLQTGVLAGADPLKPGVAISNKYDEQIEEGSDGYGTPRTRTVRRDGLYDQARSISPRLRGISQHALGHYLRDRGCISTNHIKQPGGKEARGWIFPDLVQARDAWCERFPQTEWDDSDLRAWSAAT